MEEKNRATLHNGRKGKNGVFRAGHNDRAEENTADHIDVEKSKDNIYYQRYPEEKNFEAAEKRFYDEIYQSGLAAKNLRYINQRHSERVRTMEDVYRDPKTAPEETIYQIGNFKQDVDPDLLNRIVKDQIEWEEKTFANVKYLTYGLHLDETKAAPHVQTRRAWLAHDKDGHLIPSERKALQEMGIERPKPKEKESRYNNAKMTYTARCREHFQELCRQYGLDLEVEPREKGKSGRSLDELKTETLRKDLKNLRSKKKALNKEIDDLFYKRDMLNMDIKDLKVEKDALEKEVKTKRRFYESAPARVRGYIQGAVKSCIEQDLKDKNEYFKDAAASFKYIKEHGEESWKKDWDLMSEMEKDEKRMKQKYREDDY